VGVSTVLLVAAITVLPLNLRGPIVAVTAVLEPIRTDLGISASTAGLLTSLPVLCFGLVTPLASALLARTGLGRGVSISLIVLLVGIVVRSLDGLAAALAGAVLTHAKRRFRRSAGHPPHSRSSRFGTSVQVPSDTEQLFD